MITTFPLASSSCTRKGRTSMTWASLCRSLVMMPACEPVSETASISISFKAIQSRAMVMRSPVESSMSISRLGGLGENFRAMDRRLSVVFPMAETTTAIWIRCCLTLAIRRAICLSLSMSATLLPPYFWTIQVIFRKLLKRL